MSPDTRQHRGAHPEDPSLFAKEQVPVLRAATAELSWLLTRGYPSAAALKLVGDRHRLTARQRVAVSRAACSDQSREHRRATGLSPDAVRGKRVLVDAFNVLITLEAALSGGVLLTCRDECIRDLSSVHGSYRSVVETEPAIRLAGEALAAASPADVTWLLDAPISNSGRLAQRIREIAGEQGWPWNVETVFNPDPVLIASGAMVVSSDSAVLDGASRRLELCSSIIAERLPDAWRVDLGV